MASDILIDSYSEDDYISSSLLLNAMLIENPKNLLKNTYLITLQSFSFNLLTQALHF